MEKKRNHTHKVIPTGNIGYSIAMYLSLIPYEMQGSPNGNTGQGYNSKSNSIPSSTPAEIQLTERGLKQ